MQKLSYRHRAVGTLGTLAKVLGVTTQQLQRVADNADKLYRPGPRLEKGDGTYRETWDAMPQLKSVQGRIKDRILALVDYPEYLQGGIRGRDYKQNAELHSGSRVVINEDIKNFFPSISTQAVFDIWRHFFHFPDPVAQCLAKLTTRNGEVPQGARTSTHIANLALWRSEGQLVEKLRPRGIRYSRLVDDISVSARHTITRSEKTAMVGDIVGMLSKRGFTAKRSKHAIMTSGQAMSVNKLAVNRRAGLTKRVRALIRSAVHEFEQRAMREADSQDLRAAYNRVLGRVGLLKRFHRDTGEILKKRLEAIRPQAINRQFAVRAGIA